MSDLQADSSSELRRLERAEAVLAARRRALTVVLEDAHDPHNVSAVLRTCDALGIQDVHLVAENEPDSILNPKVTIGADRWLTIHRHRGTGDAITAIRSAGYRIHVSHVAPSATSLPDLPSSGRAAYVFGNERSGVTDAWVRAADATFLIPTVGFSGSLNLSVAVALTLYDRLLGRPHAQLPPGDLSPEEHDVLRAQWYAALAGSRADRQQTYAALAASHAVSPGSLFAADRRQRASHRAS